MSRIATSSYRTHVEFLVHDPKSGDLGHVPEFLNVNNLLGYALALFFFFRGEADFLFFQLGWRRHELADSIEYYFKLSVVFPFQGVELSREIGMSRKHLPQADEGPHNLNINSNGTLTPKDA